MSKGELFAMCPYDVGSNSVEAVLDSSRYFVLKIESDGKEDHFYGVHQSLFKYFFF